MNICTGMSFMNLATCPKRSSCQLFQRGGIYMAKKWAGEWWGYRQDGPLDCFKSEDEAKMDVDD